MHDKSLGAILHEGLGVAAARQHKGIIAVQQEIAEHLNVSYETVRKWCKDQYPGEDKADAVFEFIARYVVKHQWDACDWLKHFFQHAEYFNSELLEQYCLPDNDTYEIRHNLRPRERLVGRQAEIEQVIEKLAVWPIICLEGIGGIGKSSLATEVAYHLIESGRTKPAFEGYVHILVSDSTFTLNEFLDTVARVMGFSRLIGQTSQAQKCFRLKQLLRTKRVLLIIDNFENLAGNKEVIDYVFDVVGMSKLIITTRASQLNVLNISLKGLPDTAAVDLIRLRAEQLDLQSIAAAEDEVLKPLATVTGGNPYAIKMGVGYLKQGGFALDTLIGVLAQAGEATSGIFDYIFHQAWEILGQDARYLLLTLPFFTESASKLALGAATGVKERFLDRAIAQLVELCLLEVSGNLRESDLRYRAHPLTLSFAEMKLQERPDVEQDIKRRLITFYAHWVQARLGQTIYPDAAWWTGLDNWQHYTEFDMDIGNILAVISLAAEIRMWSEVLTLAVNSMHLLWYKGYGTARLNVACLALKAVDEILSRVEPQQPARQALQVTQAWLRADGLSWVYVATRRFDEAQQELDSGRDIAKSISQRDDVDEKVRHDALDVIALADRFEAQIAIEQEHYDKARHILQRLLTEPCSLRIQNRIRCTYGQLQLKLGNLQEARQYLEEALQYCRQIGEDGECTEITWNAYWLSEVYLGIDEFGKAKQALEEAHTLTERIQDYVTTAFVERGQGQLELILGNRLTAEQLLASSYKRFVRLGMETEARETWQHLESAKQKRA